MQSDLDKVLTGFKFIDLFAGIGGFHLALSSLGAECVFASEWDGEAQKVYEANFGIIPQGDITKIDEYSIPDHDILCAGFPCQAFSICGKMLGFSDSRGTLFFDVAKITKAKKPKVVILENVRNFEKHDEGRTLAVVKATFAGLGYDFHYRVLNAAHFGVPQHRERIYMVAFRKDLCTGAFDWPQPVDLAKHVSDYLLGGEEVEHLYVQKEYKLTNPENRGKYANCPLRLGIVNKGHQGERIYSPMGTAITFCASGGGSFAKTGGYEINGRIRRLHQREAARLMGYPDTFKLHPKASQAFKQLGNSVVVDVLQLIGLKIAKALK